MESLNETTGITIGLAFTLFCSVSAGIWWASRVTSEISDLKKDVSDLTLRVATAEREITSGANRTLQLEEMMKYIRQTLDEIKIAVKKIEKR